MKNTSPLRVFVLLVLIVAAACFAIPSVRARTVDTLAFDYVGRIIQDETHEFRNQWLGIEFLQYPNDLVLYQELIYRSRPDVIIETGTYRGGLTLYLSSLLQLLKPSAQIITVDIERSHWDKTIENFNDEWGLMNRITFIEGDSVGDETISKIKAAVPEGSKVLVILDSLHTRDHVLTELRRYSEFLSVDDYMIVTDTHLDYTKWVHNQPGPMAALRAFLEEDAHFKIDTSFNRFSLSTSLHDGVLRKER